MKLRFGIESWDAWAPGVRASEILTPSTQVGDSFDTTDVEYLHITPRQRRRLSNISKITLDVVAGAMGDKPPVSSVFASRRGEVSRMAELLQDICSSGEASPTAFSLSVHNTASGLFSIQSDNQLPSCAIAAGHDSVIAGLIEANVQLAARQERVLLVIFEDEMPDIYREFASAGDKPVALALLLTSANDFELEIASASSPLIPPSTYKHVLKLLDLIKGAPAVTLEGERMKCLLQKR